MSDSLTTDHRMLPAGPVVFAIHHRDFAGVRRHPTLPGVRGPWLATQ
jgi:hypothetical protein